MIGYGLFLVWLVGGAVCGAVAGVIADERGASGCATGLLGFLIGPLAIVAAFLVPPDRKRVEAYELKKGRLRLCPYCAETMRPEAAMCPHCRSAVAQVEPPPPTFLEKLGRTFS